MPRSDYGQMITFATESDEDILLKRFTAWVWIHPRIGDTIQKIAARRGHPEDARRIADENKVRNVRDVLRHHPAKKKDRKRIKVPGELRSTLSFNVLAGDQPPRITDGYAKFSVLDRPERAGLTRFDGYNPLAMEVPVRFLAADQSNGQDVEDAVMDLERMAGRGQFSGTGSGPPAVIRVSVTGPRGGIIPLIPLNYQWSKQNPSAPLWRVVGIDWDQDPRRDSRGRRIDQKATVTLWQHTRLNLATRSSSERSRSHHG